MNRKRVFIAVTALPLMASFASVQPAQDGRSPHSMTPDERLASTVQSALAKSPDGYLAGIVEVLEAPQCSADGAKAQCRSRVRLVREVTRIDETETSLRSEPREFYWVGGTEDVSGSKYLVLVIPREGSPGEYLAVYANVVISDLEFERLQDAIRAVERR